MILYVYCVSRRWGRVSDAEAARAEMMAARVSRVKGARRPALSVESHLRTQQGGGQHWQADQCETQTRRRERSPTTTAAR
ncbi:hypothetical protein CMK11_14245 [Candidatus Poribacteria bacterium]|nr:hypothetical protein [Candidatus Poribacteria bacterium]